VEGYTWLVITERQADKCRAVKGTERQSARLIATNMRGHVRLSLVAGVRFQDTTAEHVFRYGD
jgi:hypothetical protein